MMDWLQRRRIDRKFLIWMALLLLIFPVMIALVMFGQIDPDAADLTRAVGYSLVAVMIAACFAGLYMICVGLPVTALVWIMVFNLLRRVDLPLRAAAILSAVLGRLGGVIPAGFRLGSQSPARFLAVTLLLGLVPCLISAIHFFFAYRNATWEELG